MYELQDGQVAKISAKNIALDSGFNVHILSGASFLTLIQDEDADFINHYLNITALHNDIEPSSGLITSAHNVMKEIILLKAISGGTLGRTSADTFIVNNNRASGIDSVQIYDINELLKKAYENIEEYTEITLGGGDLSNYRFRNDFEASSYEARITKLIAQVHNNKVMAALKPSLLS